MKILAPIDELKDIISKEYADGKFLSALSVNGNNLQYTLNGVDKLLTVPYASYATYADYIRAHNKQPTAETAYYPTFVGRFGATINQNLNINDTISYRLLEGTADADGKASLWLGNSVARGTAGNAFGYLRLYGSGTGATSMVAKNQTSSYTVYLPSANGTLVHHTTGTAIGTANKPVYVDSTGKVTACGNELNVRIAGFSHNTEAASSSEIPESKFEGTYFGTGGGMYMTRSYQSTPTSTPSQYGNIINLIGAGGGQIFASWLDSYKTGCLYYRSHRDTTGSGGWTPWVTILDSQNYATTLNSTYVKKAGDTMTGQLGFSGTYYPHIYGDGERLVLGGKSGTTQLVIDVNSNAVRPSSLAQTLGKDEYRWSNIYSVKGNFSGQIASSVATGTAPFVVASTTEVANLHSATATKLHTARTIALSGAVTGTATSFDGSKNVEISTTNVDASYVGGLFACYNRSVYYGHHPEMGLGLIPFLYNDLASLIARGGSCTIYKTTDTDYTQPTLTDTGEVVSVDNLEKLFDCSPNYFGFKALSTTSDVVVVDITLPSKLSYSTFFYIDFGVGGWKAKDISVYVWNDDAENSEQVYTLKSSVANSPGSAYRVGKVGYSYTNTSGTTIQGFNRLRVVLTNFSATQPRIAQIGLINYNSIGARMGYMSRGFDDVLYRNLTPAKNSAYSLGTTSARWNNIYGKMLNIGGTSSEKPYICFYRNGVSSWKIMNEAGNLVIQNNYTTAVQSSYFNVLKFGYNSGDAALKGTLTSGTLLPTTNQGASIGATAKRWANGYFVTGVFVGEANSTSTSASTPNSYLAPGFLELAGYNVYIDFHKLDGSTSKDYTSRIIENTSGTLSVNNSLFTIDGSATIPTLTTTTLKIGDATITWDSTNNALKIDKSLYSEAGVSALGIGVSEDGSATFDIIDNLTSTDANAALSANQGRVLNNSIASLATTVVNQNNRITTLEEGQPLLQNAIDSNSTAITSLQESTFKSTTDANGITLTWFTSAGGSTDRTVTIPSWTGNGLDNYDGTLCLIDEYFVDDIKSYITANAGSTVTVVNNLTSTSATSALSAAQGKVLNDKFASYMPKAGGDFVDNICLADSDIYGSENDYEYWRITYLGEATFAKVGFNTNAYITATTNNMTVRGANAIKFQIGSAADTYVMNGSAFLPATNNNYQLGTNTLKWKDLYLSGNANIDGGGNMRGYYTYYEAYLTGTYDDDSGDELWSIYADGSAYFTGVSDGSDMTRKNVISDYVLSLDSIVNAPCFTFTWIKDKDQNNVHVGTSAQYWRNVVPEIVHGEEGKNLGLEYSTLGVLMGISLAKEIVDLKARIEELENKLKEYEINK